MESIMLVLIGLFIGMFLGVIVACLHAVNNGKEYCFDEEREVENDEC